MKQAVFDHASMEALQRQWNVLQVIWTEYLASNKSGTFDILRVKLANKSGETVHSLPNILNGLSKDGLFDCREGVKNYRFSNVDPKKIETLYFEVKKSFDNESPTTTSNDPPFFDPVKCSIFFRGKEIPIPRDSNQSGICEVVFKNKTSVNKLWNWDEIVEAWGDTDPEAHHWRRVYNAARTINETVATKTTINDLLIVTNEF